jgi:hypothetical protein
MGTRTRGIGPTFVNAYFALFVLKIWPQRKPETNPANRLNIDAEFAKV